LSSAAQRRTASCCVSVIRPVSSPGITKAGPPGAAPRTAPPPPTKKAIWVSRWPDRAFVRLSACMAPPLPPPHHSTGILLLASCRIKQEASPSCQTAAVWGTGESLFPALVPLLVAVSDGLRVQAMVALALGRAVPSSIPHVGVDARQGLLAVSFHRTEGRVC